MSGEPKRESITIAACHGNSAIVVVAPPTTRDSAAPGEAAAWAGAPRSSSPVAHASARAAMARAPLVCVLPTLKCLPPKARRAQKVSHRPPTSGRGGSGRPASVAAASSRDTYGGLTAAIKTAADAGRWDEALILRFRALARGLAERGAVSTPPGATVHAFARSAGCVFPAAADELESAASAFDDVRYLRRPGSRDDYEQLRRLDEQLMAARPVAPARVGASG